jgi:glycosyltransferase involved in cell wall biosynthesis
MSQDSKNILMISPFFFPEPISTGKFNTEVALALRNKGHNVTIFCFHPFYPKWISEISDEQLEGITIIRGGKHLLYSKKTFIRRVVLELGFGFFVLRKCLKNRNNYDTVLSVFPPSFWLYLTLNFFDKKTKKIGMVHDLQEVYASNQKGVLKRIVRFFIHNIEKRCFNSCDKLIFLSQEMKNEAQNLYSLNSSQLAVQYPFVSIEERITNDLDKTLPSDKINIVYSGALGEKQNPKELYAFFDYASSKLGNSIFHFFSQGSVYDNLKSRNQNPKIHFHNLVPKENITELYKKSSVQIIPQLANTSKGSLPSKLPNLLASDTKILVITDKNSELEKLFTKYQLNEVVTSWDKVKILVSLKSILTREENLQNQKDIAKKLFHIDSMTDKILN